MPGDSRKLSQFWQELKRRKVVRVITVYAAAAFVILELVDIISEPFGLPDWTLKLVVVLLAIGLFVSIILSWIYDIHPDEGIVKTEPASGAKAEEQQATSNSWKIASYISFVVIVALIALNIMPRRNRVNENEAFGNSIAVLPFHNDSPDQENEYFINGTMESILNNLCKIKDLRVVSRSSVEQFRDATAFIPEVAKKLEVSYVLEGSMQKYGNHIRMTLQLIDHNDIHVWSEQYDREIKQVEELFALQSEIAQLVAGELEAVITPEEKQRIEKIPTTSQTAYDLYQKAGISSNIFMSNRADRDAFQEAVDLYHYAIEFESTFAEAYSNLGRIYWHWYRWDNSANKTYMDSAMFYTDIALSYDPQLAGAYIIKGNVLSHQGKIEQAISSFKKALEYNPNSAEAYIEIGWLYFNKADYVGTIENFHKSTMLDKNPDALDGHYASLGFAFTHIGFIDLAKHFYLESFKLDNDSSEYHWNIAYTEHLTGNFEKAIEVAQNGFMKDPANFYFLMIIGKSCIFLDQYEESFMAFDRLDYMLDSVGAGNVWFKPWMSFAFIMNDQKERGILLADQQIIQGNDWISNRRTGFQGQYFLNALAYAIKEDTGNFLASLKLYNQREAMDVQVVTFRNDPIFLKLWDNPEFIKVYQELESKYHAEHERVRLWLEENPIL